MWYDSKKDDTELELCVLDETIPPCRECEKHFFHQQQTFNLLEAGVVVVSIMTLVTDIVTDGLVTCQYFASGEISWGLLTLSFMLLPSLCIQFFSLRWYQMDEDLSTGKWIAHCLQSGPLYRYFIVLQTGMMAKKSEDPLDFDLLYHQQSDACMLRLFESFMESAPQVVLQLYIMVATNEENFFTGISAMVSIGSLCWAVAVYSRIHRRVREDKTVVSWPGVLLQAVWRIGMISSRVVALVLFATVFKAYVFLVIALHWTVMMVWVVLQNTDFCLTWLEERLFNAVIAVVYVFCFFNLKEGTSRYRVLVFYAVIFVENVLFLVLWHSAAVQKGVYTEIGFSIVFGGFFIGVTSMIMYYRYLHPHSSVGCCRVECTKHHPCLQHEDIIFSSKGLEAEISPRSPSPSPRPFHHQYSPLALPISTFTTPDSHPPATPGLNCPASSCDADRLGQAGREVKGQQRAKSESCLLESNGSTTGKDTLSTAKSLCGLTAGCNSGHLSEWVGHFVDEKTSLTKEFFDLLTPDILDSRPPTNDSADTHIFGASGDPTKSLSAKPHPVSRMDSVSKKLFKGSADLKMHRSFRRQLRYEGTDQETATPPRTQGMKLNDHHHGPNVRTATQDGPLIQPRTQGLPLTTTPRDCQGLTGNTTAQRLPKELLKLPANNVRSKLEVFEALGMANTSLLGSGSKNSVKSTPNRPSPKVSTLSSIHKSSASIGRKGSCESGPDISRQPSSTSGVAALANQNQQIITSGRPVVDSNPGPHILTATDEEQQAAGRNKEQQSLCFDRTAIGDPAHQKACVEKGLPPGTEASCIKSQSLVTEPTTMSPPGCNLESNGETGAPNVQDPQSPVPKSKSGAVSRSSVTVSVTVTSEAGPQGGVDAAVAGGLMVHATKVGSPATSTEAKCRDAELETPGQSFHIVLRKNDRKECPVSKCLQSGKVTSADVAPHGSQEKEVTSDGNQPAARIDTESESSLLLQSNRAGPESLGETKSSCRTSDIKGTSPAPSGKEHNGSIKSESALLVPSNKVCLGQRSPLGEVQTTSLTPDIGGTSPDKMDQGSKTERPPQLPSSDAGPGQKSPRGKVQSTSRGRAPSIERTIPTSSGKENQGIRPRKSFGNVKIKDIKESIANSPKRDLKKSRTSFSKIPTDIVAKRVSSLVSTPE